MVNERGFSNADPAQQLKQLFDINSQQPRLNLFGGMYLTEGDDNVLCRSFPLRLVRALSSRNVLIIVLNSFNLGRQKIAGAADGNKSSNEQVQRTSTPKGKGSVVLATQNKAGTSGAMTNVVNKQFQGIVSYR